MSFKGRTKEELADFNAEEEAKALVLYERGEALADSLRTGVETCDEVLEELISVYNKKVVQAGRDVVRLTYEGAEDCIIRDEGLRDFSESLEETWHALGEILDG